MFSVDEVLKDSLTGQVQEGWNVAKVVDVLQRTSKAGNQYVQITMETDRGKVWERLNLAHNSENVREIAQRTLANLCLGCGLRSLRDPMQPNELMFKEVDIFVERDSEGFFKVKQYRALAPALGQADTTAEGASTVIADDDIPF